MAIYNLLKIRAITFPDKDNDELYIEDAEANLNKKHKKSIEIEDYLNLQNLTSDNTVLTELGKVLAVIPL